VATPNRGKAPQHLAAPLAIEALPCGGAQLDEHLPCVAALADDETAQVAPLISLVVGLEPLGTCPLADRVPNRVAEVGRQPAFLDLEHLVPAACSVEAERGPVGRGRERVLQLVAIEELRLGRQDRLEGWLGDPTDPPERVAHLLLLRLELCVVGKVLEAAAAASGIVGTGGVDAFRARLDDLDGERLRVTALDLRDARTHGVAGQPATDEDDESVQPCDAVAAESERVDVELELLVLGDGRGHRRQATAGARESPDAWEEAEPAAVSAGSRSRGRGCRGSVNSRARRGADQGARRWPDRAAPSAGNRPR